MADSASLSAAEMRAKRVAALEAKSALSSSEVPKGETKSNESADDAAAAVEAEEPEPKQPEVPALTPRSQAEEDFAECARTFAVESMEAKCDYVFSMRPIPKPVGLVENRQEADRRMFLTIWSQPTPECPTPPAVVHVNLEVVRKPMGKTGAFAYGVTTYQVEYAKHFKDASVPFEERWLDEVIRRKLMVRNLVYLGDDFLDTRVEEKHNGDPEIPVYIAPTCVCAPPVEHCMKCKVIRRMGDA
jgi:hypothetical protein